jgi:holin-like protein
MHLIPGLTQILLFQGLGEIVSRFVLPVLPGPVIGLMALLGFLVLRGRVNAALDAVATGFTQHLGLLFVPAAVGVVLFLPQLRANAVALAVALVVSVVATMAVTALVLRFLSRKAETPNDDRGAP